jgi:hypothetical protein
MQARASIIAACASLALLAQAGSAHAFFFCFSFGGDGGPGFGAPPPFPPPPYGFAPHGYLPYGPPPFAPGPYYGSAPMTPWQAPAGIAAQSPLPPAAATPVR